MRENDPAQESQWRKSMNRRVLSFCFVFSFLIGRGVAEGQGENVGIFEGHQDVGTVLHPGSTNFDAAKQSYTVTGSGENMWFGVDDFQFATRPQWT
jgi:TolB protein